MDASRFFFVLFAFSLPALSNAQQPGFAADVPPANSGRAFPEAAVAVCHMQNYSAHEGYRTSTEAN